MPRLVFLWHYRLSERGSSPFLQLFKRCFRGAKVHEGPIVPDLPLRTRLVPQELAIRCTRVWKALAYITLRVQDLGFLGRHHHLPHWGDASLYLCDLWLQLSKNDTGQPAWLRASPNSTRGAASPAGGCGALEPAQEHWGEPAEGQQGAALPWLKVLLWVLSLGVRAMLFHWCWLRNNSVHTISAFN